MNKLVCFKRADALFLSGKMYYFKNSFFNHNNNGGGNMTEKELLYVEDFLGHEQYLLQHMMETKECVDDEKFEKFITKLEKKNQDLVMKFYDLL